MPNRGHKRRLPQGTALAKLLRQWLARIRHDAAARIGAALRHGMLPRLDLSRWLKPMADTIMPVMIRYWQQGATETAAQIGRLVHESGRQRNHDHATSERHRGRVYPLSGGGVGLRRSATNLRCKSGWRVAKRDATAIAPEFEFAFNIFNPKTIEYIQQHVYTLCQATLDTLTTDLGRGMSQFRGLLQFGIAEGETTLKINQMVGAVFDSPYRAARIAQTEVSRAIHAADVLTMKESGVVSGKRWLASSDACDACLALNGKEVGIDDPFIIDPKGRGQYAAVYQPPRH